MHKVVTAVLQNTDEFATLQTFRGRLVDDPPADAQRRAADAIGKRLLAMNATAIKARYDILPPRPVFKFAGWADSTPIEQFKAMRCLLDQTCEDPVPNGRLEPGHRGAGPADRASLARIRESLLGLNAPSLAS